MKLVIYVYFVVSQKSVFQFTIVHDGRNTRFLKILVIAKALLDHIPIVESVVLNANWILLWFKRGHSFILNKKIVLYLYININICKSKSIKYL